MNYNPIGDGVAEALIAAVNTAGGIQIPASTIGVSWTRADGATEGFMPFFGATGVSQNFTITDPITQAETSIDCSGKWLTQAANFGTNTDSATGTSALGIQLASISYADIVGANLGSSMLQGLSSLFACTTVSAPLLKILLSSSTVAISNASLTALSFPELVVIGGSWQINFSSASALAAMSMPKLQYLFGLFSGASSGFPCATWNFPLLKAISQSLTVASSAAITAIDFSSLTHIGGTYTQATTTAGLTSIPLPAIVSVVGGLSITSTAISVNPSMANLKYLLAASTISGGSFNTLSLPALAYCFSLTLSTLTSLTTISLPALVAHGAFTFSSGNGNIATVTMGTIGALKRVIAGSTINLSGQKMTSATVNAILALYASLDGTNGTTAWASGTINVSGGTNGAPTGQGITDKATCQARGLTVTTN